MANKMIIASVTLSLAGCSEPPLFQQQANVTPRWEDVCVERENRINLTPFPSGKGFIFLPTPSINCMRRERRCIKSSSDQFCSGE